MTKNGNNTISWRVNLLEKRVDSMDSKIDEILANHLPHLHEELASLRTRINVMTAFNVGAIILGVLIAKYL